MTDKQHQTQDPVPSTTKPQNAPYQRDFRLADRITIRTTGSDGIELLLAGDPKVKTITSTELAALLEEKYFTD